MTVQIGTSGWNYKHWRGLFYPQGLAQSRWLEFYSRQFTTVEINTSFYRIPRAESAAKWVENTPAGFRFAVKLWRGITHYKKLLNSAPFLSSFFEVVDVIPSDRRAPLLVQLPPNQRRNLEKLAAFLAELRDTASDWDFAVEFRNDDWLTEETYALLDREHVAICLHDMAGRAATNQPGSAPLVYVRRHGSGEGRYAGSYSPEQIAADAECIRRWTYEGRRVFVYYNNDIGGHAITNARQLRGALGIPDPGSQP